MKKIRREKIPAEKIAEAADRGEDVTRYFAGRGRMMPGLSHPEIQRVNVDFTAEILDQLDREAKRLNISRQAVIKTLISDALDHKAIIRARNAGETKDALRGKKRAS